ncbi:MAG: hypothetical protein K8S56_04055 [Candidatus Cloacimonetes bacterium]|nr:hypothetical protein [Candidatus Cloacimonadota bacterium]
MKSQYKPVEIRAAIVLKSLSTVGLAKRLRISRRTLDYFIHGEMGMSRSEEFLKILQPELDEIHQIGIKFGSPELQQCEVS